MSERPLQILLVEDDEDDAWFSNRALRRLPGVVVSHVWSSEDAIVFMRANRVDVVLVDLDLGTGMNGLGLVEFMKAQTDLRPLPVVMLTSSRAPDEVLAGYTAGVAGWLKKPVDMKKFGEIADKIADWWKTNELPNG